MAEQQRKRPDREQQDDPERMAANERARKAYDRMKSLAVGMGAKEASRTAARFSKWANPAHAQWREINRHVTTAMVKSVWPCPQSETDKGRWKVNRCHNAEIKLNAERIFLEVFGHPLHNADSPLYFAKMLYHQFVEGVDVDFSSKEVNHTTHDIREESVTFTRRDLQDALEGAHLELCQEKERLLKSLQDKERIIEAQTPPHRQGKLLEQLSQDVHSMAQKMPTRCHLSDFLQHPEAAVPPAQCAGSSTQSPYVCPACDKRFDDWSGYYTLGCGHYYHLVCLVRWMITTNRCCICQWEIPDSLYSIFGMAQNIQPKAGVGEGEGPRGGDGRSASSVLRNINFDDLP